MADKNHREEKVISFLLLLGPAIKLRRGELWAKHME